jgi:hypothetical protein
MLMYTLWRVLKSRLWDAASLLGPNMGEGNNSLAVFGNALVEVATYYQIHGPRTAPHNW